MIQFVVLHQECRRRPRLGMLLSLLLLSGQIRVRPDTVLDSPQAALTHYSPRVLRVDATTKEGTVRRTCIVNQAKVIDDQMEVELLTCFHVLAGATSFNVYDRNSFILLDSNQNKISYTADPDRDLVALKSSIPLRLLLDSRNPLSNFASHPRLSASKDKDFEQGYALGYPYYNHTFIYPTEIRIGRVTQARSIGLGNPVSDHKLRFIPQGTTASGMSGGLVIGNDGGFVGIILGRIPDVSSVCIPSIEVFKFLTDANWNKFHPNCLPESLLPLPISTMVTKQHTNQRIPEDKVSLEDLGIFSRLFKDNTTFRRRFQEPSINLSSVTIEKLRKTGLTVSYSAGFSPDDIKDNARYVLSVNGQEAVTQNAKTKTEPMEVEISKFFQPGENLLIIRKQRDDHSLGVNSLFLDNEMNLEFILGNEPLFRLKRNLPRIFHSYSIFTTVALAPPIQQLEPNEFDIEFDTLESHISKQLERTPFRFPLTQITDSEGVLKISGEFKLMKTHTGKYLNLTPTGHRKLEIELAGNIKLDELSISGFGFNTSFPAVNAIPVKIGLVLQFLPASTGIQISWRMVQLDFNGAPLKLQVGQLGDKPVTVDMTTIAQEGLIDWVNTHLGRSGRFHKLNEESAGRIKKLLPVSHLLDNLKDVSMLNGNEKEGIRFVLSKHQ